MQLKNNSETFFFFTLQSIWHKSWIRLLIDALRSPSFVLLYLACLVLELSFISAHHQNMESLICSSVSCGFICLKYTQRHSIKQGAELMRSPLCVLESSYFFPPFFFFQWLIISVDAERWLSNGKKKQLFNYTDPFNSWWVSHIKTIQGLLPCNNTFQSLCFMQGAISSPALPHLQCRLAPSTCVRGRKGKQSCTNKTIISSLWIREPHLQLIHGQVGFVKRVQCRVCSTNALQTRREHVAFEVIVTLNMELDVAPI